MNSAGLTQGPAFVHVDIRETESEAVELSKARRIGVHLLLQGGNTCAQRLDGVTANEMEMQKNQTNQTPVGLPSVCSYHCLL